MGTRTRIWAAVPAIGALALVAGGGPAGAAGGGAADDAAGAAPDPSGHGTARCERQFDRAVQTYVDATEGRDAVAFNALLDDDVTIIFANGGVLYGQEQSARFIVDFFADPGWDQSFREITRTVESCRTGFVLFDSVYSVPAEERVSPLVIGLTFTYERGRWLLLHNQDSTGPAS